MLGTNDAAGSNWKGAEAFESDYRDIIRHYISLPSKPKIYLMTPPSQFKSLKNSHSVLIKKMERLGIISDSIRKLAHEMSIKVIDIKTITGKHPECFRFDGVHPDAKGAKIIADAVYTVLTLNPRPPQLHPLKNLNLMTIFS
jgi:lysophospholipase L1-like esterase